MAWVRLEDTFPEHPKLLTVGGDAGWLHVCAIAYCSRNLTDGFIPSGAVRQLSDRRQPIKLAMALVDAALWERVDGGFVVHDYLDYHPTREEVLKDRADKSAKKAAAGKLGGIASGISRRKHNGSTAEANGEAKREANSKQNEAPSRPVPSPSVVTSPSPVTSADCPDSEAQPPAGFERVVALIADGRTRRAEARNPQHYRAVVEHDVRATLGPAITQALADHPDADPQLIAIDLDRRAL